MVLDWEELGLEGMFHWAGTGGGGDNLVGGVGGDEAAGKELGREEGKVILDREDGRLCVKMPNAGHLHAAGCNAEGRVLEGLESIDVGGFDVGEPYGGCISDDRAYKGFESD